MRFKLNSFNNNKIDKYHEYFYHFNELNLTNKFLYILLPDSGPGNQIISIKEAIIISRILKSHINNQRNKTLNNKNTAMTK